MFSPRPLIAASMSLADTMLFLKYSLDHFLGGDMGKVGKAFQGSSFLPPLVSSPVVLLPPVFGGGEGSKLVAERVSGRACLSSRALRETLVMPVVAITCVSSTFMVGVLVVHLVH